MRRAAAGALLLLVVAACGPGGEPEDPPAAPTAEPTAGTAPTAAPSEEETVRLEVGDDFQAVVAMHPPGTHFVIASGLHRTQRVTVRDGDTYTGEEGAVMSGARVLTGAVEADGLWLLDEQFEDDFAHGDMQPGHEREAYRQDLWIDGVRQRHVATRDLVAPGSWFFDYDTGELWFADGPRRGTEGPAGGQAAPDGGGSSLGEDPEGRLVELAVTDFAFLGEDTRDVTIQDLEVRQYATLAQRGAISGYLSHNWHLRRVVASANHGAGIRVGSGTLLEDCEVHDNGQIGIVGGEQDPTDRPIVVTRCEVSGNGQLGFRWQWEAGGTKFSGSRDMRFVDNHIFDNLGPGIWFDIDNVDAEILDNRVLHNAVRGIWYEISFGAVIAGNEVRDNGWGTDPGLRAGIVVANATNVTVRDNVLSGNGYELFATDYYDRGDSELGRYQTTGMRVVDNDITLAGGTVGFYIDDGGDATVLGPEGDQGFSGNAYVLDGCEPCFWWGEPLDVEGWQALGFDVDGTFVRAEP